MKLPLNVWIIFVLLLSGCAPGLRSGPVPTPTLTQTALPTASPTFTPRPTDIPTPTSSPTPALPVFSGRIFAILENELVEVSAEGTPGEILSRSIAAHVINAAISPDGRYLVYSTFSADLAGRTTHLYDLGNDSDELILPYDADRLLWSPDGQLISYTAFGIPNTDDGLYLYDLETRTSRLVYEPPCAAYSMFSTRSVCGALDEMAWAGPNVLVFQRYKGEMPLQIPGTLYAIPANTTTLLTIAGGSQALVDSPRRWLVQDQCDGRVLLRENEEGIASHFYLADTGQFIASPGAVDVIPLMTCPEGGSDCVSLSADWTTASAYHPYIGFLPNSCSVFYFSGDKSAPLFHILSPEGVEERSIPFPARLGYLAFRSDVTLTPGWLDSRDAQVALMPDFYSIDIEIVSLQTGEVLKVVDGSHMYEFALLGWLAP